MLAVRDKAFLAWLQSQEGNVTGVLASTIFYAGWDARDKIERTIHAEGPQPRSSLCGAGVHTTNRDDAVTCEQCKRIARITE